MAKTNKKRKVKAFKVWIGWGSNMVGGISEYKFNTLAELNAFLTGVDAASGWMEHTQFDSKKEADHARYEKASNEAAEADEGT